METLSLTNELLFRISTSQDARAIAQLVNSAYRGDSSRRGWTTEADFLAGQRTDPQALSETILKPQNWILLCYRQDRLVGTVHLEKKSAETCYLGMLAVDPDSQSSGIGKKFIFECERFAREELGCQKIEMTVITIRPELVAWYERRGYWQTGEVRPFPYGDERFGIPLRKDIALGVLEKRL